MCLSRMCQQGKFQTACCVPWDAGRPAGAVVPPWLVWTARTVERGGGAAAGLPVFHDTQQTTFEEITVKDSHVRMYALSYLLDNIYIRFGTKLYRQIVGIPMGTNCAPLVADLFLYCYERDFMDSLNHENQADVSEAFNSTSR